MSKNHRETPVLRRVLLARRNDPLMAALVAASLYGCSGETHQGDVVGPDADQSTAREWKTLPDGSRAYFEQLADGSESMERCWQVGRKWDCLAAFTLGRSKASEASADATVDTDMGGPRFIAARALKKRLDVPFPHSDEDNLAGGYRCDTTGGGILSEEIFTGTTNGGTTLLSNDSAPGQSYGGSPWSADFVTKFMAENGVRADRPYWNCGHVERLVASGSLATLTTTALTYDEMIGPESAEARW
ncbi:MAG: hypothetical protein VX569_12685 [Pseudomonadota bacterium]|nr:hypothetical protein [Pseudomonadota bacterium]